MPQETPTPNRPGVLALSEAQLTDLLAAWDQPAYRAGQIRSWLLQRRATRFNDMTSLPTALRKRLQGELVALSSDVEEVRSAKDGTEKLLLGLADGCHVECVLLSEGRRRTVCLSTQVGCAMDCRFCASAEGGLQRHLASHEIVEQALHTAARLPAEERLTHVVVMGMGEPLANLDNVLAALEAIRAPEGPGIGARHITISTVGLLRGIARLAATGVSYHLAISLHAPTDALRRELMPTAARRTPLAKLVEAGKAYQARTGRQVTYEYALMAGVNDGPEHARQLARLLGPKQHVNLIRLNPVPGLSWRASPSAVARAFAARLKGLGLHATTRKRKGAGIDAACGQLRRRVEEAEK